jgi:hypothetical protein
MAVYVHKANATQRNARQIRILLRPTLHIQRDANSKYDPNGVG